MSPRLALLALPLLLAACASTPQGRTATATDREPDEYEADDILLRDHDVPHVVVAEAFVTPSTPDDNIDSPASWLQDGKRMLVASAKATDQLVVYDGSSGERLRISAPELMVSDGPLAADKCLRQRLRVVLPLHGNIARQARALQDLVDLGHGAARPDLGDVASGPVG